MSVDIKTPKEIEAMRAACRLAAETLIVVGEKLRPGMTTREIDEIVHEDTLRRGGYPAPLNYHGFPKSVCTSVNDVVCHGIPGDEVLRAGDIINVDVTTIYAGFHGERRPPSTSEYPVQKPGTSWRPRARRWTSASMRSKKAHASVM